MRPFSVASLHGSLREFSMVSSDSGYKCSFGGRYALSVFSPKFAMRILCVGIPPSLAVTYTRIEVFLYGSTDSSESSNYAQCFESNFLPDAPEPRRKESTVAESTISLSCSSGARTSLRATRVFPDPRQSVFYRVESILCSIGSLTSAHPTFFSIPFSLSTTSSTD